MQFSVPTLKILNLRKILYATRALCFPPDDALAKYANPDSSSVIMIMSWDPEKWMIFLIRIKMMSCSSDTVAPNELSRFADASSPMIRNWILQIEARFEFSRQKSQWIIFIFTKKIKSKFEAWSKKHRKWLDGVFRIFRFPTIFSQCFYFEFSR